MRPLPDHAPWADDVRRAAAVLYEGGARAVWLFGSRARGRAPDRLTDFDLAVEGLPVSAPAMAKAARALRGKTDIVALESAQPGLRWHIARNRIFVPREAAVADAPPARPPLPDSLAGWRTRAVAARLREIAPRSVIDFGCGQGWLLAELAGGGGIERLTGVDFNSDSLAVARQRIGAAAPRAPGIALHEALLTHRDPVFLGHDAAAAVEVIEHLDHPQLEAFTAVVFDFARPRRVVVTTPNADYNVVWLRRHAHGRRHADHRFEWSRAEFADWSDGVASAYRYEVRLLPVGTPLPDQGPPTQMAVFDRGEAELVAGDCNNPKALVIPFRPDLAASA